jgi:hypothetical protein
MSERWELIVFVVLVAVVSCGGTLLLTSVVNTPLKLRDAPFDEATQPRDSDTPIDEADSPAERRAA